MWALDTDREGLFRILQEERGDENARPEIEFGESRIEKGRIRLFWKNPERLDELPVVIALPHREIDEFFAWTNTYLPNWSPITAFFRVVSNLDELKLNSYEQQAIGIEYKPAQVGLIIGEALLQSGGQRDIASLPYSGCIATFSFAAARGLKYGISLEELAERWHVCRRSTEQGPLTLQISELLGPWRIFEELARSSVKSKGKKTPNAATNTIKNALIDIVNGGEVSGPTWKTVTRGFPDVRIALSRMRDTQEERIVAFEKMLEAMRSVRRSQSLEASFLIGYVASLIAPGSLKHAYILAAHLNRFPTAVIWLSLFAYIYKKSQLRATKLAHLVWRAIEEEEELLSRPKCDIALPELSVLRDAGFIRDTLHGNTKGRLIVDLAPGVSTTVRWPQKGQSLSNYSSGELFQGDAVDVQNISAEIARIYWDFGKVLDKLERLNINRK